MHLFLHLYTLFIGSFGRYFSFFFKFTDAGSFAWQEPLIWIILKSPSSRGGSGTLYQQSAIVGVISRRGSGRWSCPSQVALTSGSCAMGIREPGQGRNTAALSESSHVTWGCLGGVNCKGNVYCFWFEAGYSVYVIFFFSRIWPTHLPYA